jgi:hypothetical protein
MPTSLFVYSFPFLFYSIFIVPFFFFVHFVITTASHSSQVAQSSIKGRRAEVERVAEKIERNLDLLGATGMKRS